MSWGGSNHANSFINLVSNGPLFQFYHEDVTSIEERLIVATDSEFTVTDEIHCHKHFQLRRIHHYSTKG
jgi:hypothetical protein